MDPAKPESAQPASTKPRFPLLSLPRELRDNIYEHVNASSSAHPIKVFHKERIDCYIKEDEKRATLAKGSYAGLARVCRQIRHEYLRIHRRHAHVLINYSDIDYWFRNCNVETESVWHVRHVHIAVSLKDDYFVKEDRHILPLLQYRAHHLATFDCSFEFVEEIPEDLLMSSGSYSWSDGHLTNAYSPSRRYRKDVQDANTLVAHSEEGWLALLREDSSIITDVMLSFRDYLYIHINTREKLDRTVNRRLLQCFRLENNKQGHLPEARLAGPEITIRYPEVIHEYSLDPVRGVVRGAFIGLPLE